MSFPAFSTPVSFPISISIPSLVSLLSFASSHLQSYPMSFIIIFFFFIITRDQKEVLLANF
ncbi:hypothetical protein BDV41DRAFT_270133 [Aspergillus transmontanensis]|uniref:Uncharacterized protein n=1 Tax=Aspergillus transmontanensis TaxID=1034304 RepID=A0A5N6VXT5_9EURO|nr:hypothetical protein BDV41DRAFT_270133 [Aspergillus transmontanensis]